MSDKPDFVGHLFSYSLNGAQWSIMVQAVDEADARRRLSTAAMGHYDGILMFTLPAITGPVARLVVWLRNLFARYP